MKAVPYPAPNFALPNSEGKIISLSDFAGKWLVVYFYPKDDTPVCTVEACSIRDAHDELTNINAHVVGISADDSKSHQSFAANHNLSFNLLSDENHQTIRDYGAWGKKMFGREGILRQTFIIDPNGKVVKVYGRVKSLGHGAQIVEDIKNLQKA